MSDATCADVPRREDCAVVRAGGGAGRQQDLPPHPPGARAQAAPLPRQAGQEVTEVGSGHCISEGKLCDHLCLECRKSKRLASVMQSKKTDHRLKCCFRYALITCLGV